MKKAVLEKMLDDTRVKEIETELRRSNEFFTNLIESSVDAIVAADMKGNIIIFNKAAERLLGWEAEEAMRNVHVTQLYSPGTAHEIMRRLRTNEYGGVGKMSPCQMTATTKFGEHIPVNISAAIVYENSREIASVGFFYDLREKIRAEKKLRETHLQLLQSEKMASLGKLAAGVAHEINNPLSGILIYSNLLLEEMEKDDSRRQDLERIVEETIRCKEIVKGLLEFAHQTGFMMKPIDLNRAVDQGLFLLENQALFHNIRIVRELDPALPQIIGNSGQLNQVFMNMILNAAEAMDGNGTLTVRTSILPGDKTVSVEFADTGCGIPEERISRIFEPFFTTKEVGRGTGLGLSMSYGIIEAHKGKIDVKSEIGKGSTFRIELPVEGNSGRGGREGNEG